MPVWTARAPRHILSRARPPRPGPNESPQFTIDVPANTSIERGRLFFDGYSQVQSGQYLCERPGEYSALLWVNAAVGGRRVRSTAAAWTLVEKESARARCAGDR